MVFNFVEEGMDGDVNLGVNLGMSRQMWMWHGTWEQRHGRALDITNVARYISIQLRG
jgi:hypothetical protein